MRHLVRLLGRLRDYDALPCVRDAEASCSYASLLAGLAHWRERFDQWQVAAGTAVAIRADHSWFATAALLALLERRAIAALLPRDRDAELCLKDSCASALLELEVNGAHEWRPLPSAAGHLLIDQLRASGDGGIVIFTSGSSGRPKAALQSTERFLRKFRDPGRRLRTLAFLRFDHLAGLDTVFYTLANGGELVLTRRRDPQAILDLVESQGIEVLPVSPSFLRSLRLAVDPRQRDLSSLKIISYGSEPMDASTLARINQLFPNVRIIQKYGTTETGSPRSRSRGNDSLWLRIGSDDVETRIIDGVLWMRSESTILGYLNAPSPFDADGWYCTGDLVDCDGDWIRFRGRDSDIINVGGEKVAPLEVAQSILELPFVREVLVFGDAHPLVGHTVAARVSLSESVLDAKEAVKSIRRHCRERLAPYKVPIRIDATTDALTGDRQKLPVRPISS